MTKTHRILGVLLGLLLAGPPIITGFPPPAAATSCAAPESADEVQAAIIATVVDKTAAGTRDDGDEQVKYFRYDVDDVSVLHGSVPQNLVVEAPVQNGINLGLTLNTGTRYGFTFYRFDGNVGGVGACSVSEPDAVRNLANIVAPAAGTEFFAAPETPLPPSAGGNGVIRWLILAVGATVVLAAIRYGGQSQVPN